MLKGFLGNKIGMSQLFDEKGSAIPVTVVSYTHWFVTQIKTVEKDGYAALQLGKLKKKYQGNTFAQEWLLDKKKYFSYVREVKLAPENGGSFTIGQEINLDNITANAGDKVDVSGISIGKGFQGVVKRWGFAGGPSAHGSMFHRRPGAISHMRSRGRVIKGKRLPGQCGTRTVTVKGLQIVKLSHELGCVFIKGSVPGKKDALLQMHIKNK